MFLNIYHVHYLTRGFPDNVNLPIQIGQVIIKIGVTTLQWGVLKESHL